MYGLYGLTNMVWMLNTYLSAATGYVVQEAYKLDFIKDLSKTLGSNIQTIAGVSKSGFSSDGFYLGLISLIILVVGIYARLYGIGKKRDKQGIFRTYQFSCDLCVFLVHHRICARIILTCLMSSLLT